jgi:mRNA-degrading endonuclease YafQ of YafQ-DinJ toxin-antitoxin module
MIEVAFDKSFKRASKKKVKGKTELEKKFWNRLKTFIDDPFDASLRTHKLSGKLKDLWSFSLDHDVGVIFYFVKESKAVLSILEGMTRCIKLPSAC